MAAVMLDSPSTMMPSCSATYAYTMCGHAPSSTWAGRVCMRILAYEFDSV